MTSDLEDELKQRTLEYGYAAIQAEMDAPPHPTAGHLAHQMMRAATSAGAHYREATRARSDAEFTSKLDGALQELEEARYWLRLLARAQFGSIEQLRNLWAESTELIALFTSIVVSTKSNDD